MTATPIKVLVIDDEPPIRKLLRMGLSTQGYEILEASNGKLALELLAEAPALIAQSAKPAHNAAASMPRGSFFNAMGSRFWP